MLYCLSNCRSLATNIIVLSGYQHNCIRAAVAQWIRPRTLNREVPGSNLRAAAVVPLGKALYPHCFLS